jgi:hypothetical protein
MLHTITAASASWANGGTEKRRIALTSKRRKSKCRNRFGSPDLLSCGEAIPMRVFRLIAETRWVGES